MTQSLPQLSGDFVTRCRPGMVSASTGLSTGVFSDTKYARGQYYDSGHDNDSIYTITFSANNCNEIYQDNANVVPKSVKVYFHIKYL